MNEFDLSRIYLFKELSQNNLNQISQNCIVKTLPKDAILFYEGDRPEYFTVLLEGIVKLYKTDMRFNQIILHYITAISPIAELVNINDIKYPATAEAITDIKVLQISHEFFQKNILENQQISKELIKSLTSKIMILESVIANNITLNSTARVAKFLFANAKLFSTVKHHEIASILNIQPETMSRVLAKFKSNKIIKADGKGFIVEEPEKLRNYFI